MDRRPADGLTNGTDAQAAIFGALSDPTRLALFRTLVAAAEPLYVTELGRRTGVAPNLASHHLGRLRECHLVNATSDGRKRFYEVATPEAARLVNLAARCAESNGDRIVSSNAAEDE